MTARSGLRIKDRKVDAPIFTRKVELVSALAVYPSGDVHLDIALRMRSLDRLDEGVFLVRACARQIGNCHGEEASRPPEVNRCVHPRTCRHRFHTGHLSHQARRGMDGKVRIGIIIFHLALGGCRFRQITITATRIISTRIDNIRSGSDEAWHAQMSRPHPVRCIFVGLVQKQKNPPLLFGNKSDTSHIFQDGALWRGQRRRFHKPLAIACGRCGGCRARARCCGTFPQDRLSLLCDRPPPCAALR